MYLRIDKPVIPGYSGADGEWTLVMSAEMEPIGVVNAVTAVSMPLFDGRLPNGQKRN